MNKKLQSILKLIISLGFGALLIWLVLKNLTEKDKLEISDAFSRVNYWWVLLSASLGLLSHIVRAVRWKMLIVPLGYNPGIRNTFFAVMTMYIGNLAFPRLGEVMRCGVMTRYEGVPFQKALGTMVTERFIDVLFLLLVGVLTLITQYDRLFDYFNNVIIEGLNQKAGLLDNLWWISLLGVAIVFIFGYLLFRFRKKFTILNKIVEIIKGIVEGVKSIRNINKPWLFWFYSFAIWFLYLTMITCVFHALSETSSLGLMSGLAVLFFGSFAIIAVQGELGHIH